MKTHTSIAGPVTFTTNKKFLGLLQTIENFSLQGATIGSFSTKTPFMCNGANLCYNKQEFITLNKFEGNFNIASGDDVFTLENFKKIPKQNLLQQSHSKYSKNTS